MKSNSQPFLPFSGRSGTGIVKSWARIISTEERKGPPPKDDKSKAPFLMPMNNTSAPVRVVASSDQGGALPVPATRIMFWTVCFSLIHVYDRFQFLLFWSNRPIDRRPSWRPRRRQHGAVGTRGSGPHKSQKEQLCWSDEIRGLQYVESVVLVRPHHIAARIHKTRRVHMQPAPVCSRESGYIDGLHLSANLLTWLVDVSDWLSTHKPTTTTTMGDTRLVRCSFHLVMRRWRPRQRWDSCAIEAKAVISNRTVGRHPSECLSHSGKVDYWYLPDRAGK